MLLFIVQALYLCSRVDIDVDEMVGKKRDCLCPLDTRGWGSRPTIRDGTGSGICAKLLINFLE